MTFLERKWVFSYVIGFIYIYIYLVVWFLSTCNENECFKQDLKEDCIRRYGNTCFDIKRNTFCVNVIEVRCILNEQFYPRWSWTITRCKGRSTTTGSLLVICLDASNLVIDIGISITNKGYRNEMGISLWIRSLVKFKFAEYQY